MTIMYIYIYMYLSIYLSILSHPIPSYPILSHPILSYPILSYLSIYRSIYLSIYLIKCNILIYLEKSNILGIITKPSGFLSAEAKSDWERQGPIAWRWPHAWTYKWRAFTTGRVRVIITGTGYTTRMFYKVVLCFFVQMSFELLETNSA